MARHRSTCQCPVCISGRLRRARGDEHAHKTYSIYLVESSYEALRAHAEAASTSVSDLVQRALDDYLARIPV
ncbi:MAG: ribbon-helix-helix protein, CopG family [Patescibacteria group bacterium]|nr:ribbon-helix-helix protein, CopG family [Patescibacteria group bacterium]